jgi:hypothetical protein
MEHLLTFQLSGNDSTAIAKVQELLGRWQLSSYPEFNDILFYTCVLPEEESESFGGQLKNIEGVSRVEVVRPSASSPSSRPSKEIERKFELSIKAEGKTDETLKQEIESGFEKQGLEVKAIVFRDHKGLRQVNLDPNYQGDYSVDLSLHEGDKTIMIGIVVCEAEEPFDEQM